MSSDFATVLFLNLVLAIQPIARRDVAARMYQRQTPQTCTMSGNCSGSHKRWNFKTVELRLQVYLKLKPDNLKHERLTTLVIAIWTQTGLVSKRLQLWKQG
eukprot:4813551-Amphidinium_carterae.1